MSYRGYRGGGMERGVQAIFGGIDARRERKEKQKQEESLLKGVEQMMQHPEIARYFPEDFDPYAVGAEGTFAALNMVSQSMQWEQQEEKTAAARMQREQAELGIREEDRFLTQLEQHAGGAGAGVYRPEVRESYRDLLDANPMASAAAETGVRPEVLQRYGIGAAGEGASAFAPEDMGRARPIEGVEGRYFVPTSQTAGQVVDTSAAAQAQTPEERLYAAWERAAGEGDAQRADFLEDVIQKRRQGTMLSPIEQAFMEQMGIDTSGRRGEPPAPLRWPSDRREGGVDPERPEGGVDPERREAGQDERQRPSEPDMEFIFGR